jgi:adhesin/invasin
MCLMRMRLPIFLALVAVAACHKDSTGLDTTTPTASSPLISVDSGVNGQFAPVQSTIPIKVKVTIDSVPQANTVVTWTPSAGSTAAAASSTTNASGIATVGWTIGDTARTYSLTATVTGGSLIISATGVGIKPTALVKVTPDSSATVAGSAIAVVARATDKFGNGSPGQVLNWTSSGGTLSVKTTTTGNSGNGQVNFTTGAAGTYTVTATAPGIGSVTFKIVAL